MGLTLTDALIGCIVCALVPSRRIASFYSGGIFFRAAYYSRFAAWRMLASSERARRLRVGCLAWFLLAAARSMKGRSVAAWSDPLVELSLDG